MQIVIVGITELSKYVTEVLKEEGHSIVVVDKDAAACRTFSSETDVLAVQGDATEPKILEQAGIEKSDAIVALTKKDDVNMMAALLGKELGARKAVARMNVIDYDENVLKKMGLDIVVHPNAAAAGYIASMIASDSSAGPAFIDRSLVEMIELEASDENGLAGKKVKEIEHPAGSIIVLLKGMDGTKVPSPETEILTGMNVIIIAKQEFAARFRKI